MTSLKDEFAKLCRSPVVRGRTKKIINKYRRRLGDSVEIDDVLSEVFLRAWKMNESGRTIHNLSAWVRTTSLNVVRERYRIENRERTLEGRAEQDYKTELIVPDDLCDPEDSTVNKLWARLEMLSPSEKRLLLWEAEGTTYRKISDLLIEEGFEKIQVSENAIAQRIRRARKKLNNNGP